MSSSKSHRKNESLIKNLETATKKMINKEYKTHYRHSSMEVKLNEKSINNASHNSHASNNNSTICKDRSPGALINQGKNIHAMKEMLYPSTGKVDKSSSKNPKSKVSSRQANTTSTSNIIVNQGGNPCFNHITIYASNNSTSIKPNDINLRQYIFNKVSSKPKSLSKLGHHRSASTNMQH